MTIVDMSPSSAKACVSTKQMNATSARMHANPKLTLSASALARLSFLLRRKAHQYDLQNSRRRTGICVYTYETPFRSSRLRIDSAAFKPKVVIALNPSRRDLRRKGAASRAVLGAIGVQAYRSAQSSRRFALHPVDEKRSASAASAPT
jgi:hypothetical protein